MNPAFQRQKTFSKLYGMVKLRAKLNNLKRKRVSNDDDGSDDISDIEDNALDTKMTSIYARQNKAIKNWQKFGNYVHMLRSVGFNLVDRSQRQFSDLVVDQKRAWYEGQLVISPVTVWYRLWDIFKSIMYMISLYTLAYDAAFIFESGLQTAGFEMFIDLV